MYEHGLFDRESIEVWNDQMILVGTAIHAARKQFLEEFIPVFQSNYNYIGLEIEEVHLEYRSQLNTSSFADLLVQYEQKDAFTHHSNAGIHKDDLIFTIKGHPVKKFGSQGQQKSFLIALKLAQYEWLKRHLNVNPVLMLDDIFDKLDNDRVQKLMELVSQQHFGQVLVTDTDPTRIQAIFKESGFDSKNFIVNNGEIIATDNSTYEDLESFNKNDHSEISFTQNNLNS
jgi:DNA replication and repair protein RecF